MSPLFAWLLALHIVLGVIALMANYTTLLSLLKKVPSQRWLVGSGLIASTLYVLSWIAGGYYYVYYYGGAVKPVITSGVYPWAHLVVMEWKEHVFLMLPALTLLMTAACWLLGDKIGERKIRGASIFLVSVITVLATLITLSGIIISGSAR